MRALPTDSVEKGAFTMSIFIGVILLLVSVGLVFAYRSAKAKMLDMASAETFTAASLKETADAVAKEIGEGSFNQICEVKGMIKCNIPLTSELKKIPCVYYSASIVEEYEETYYERDSQGVDQRRTRTKTHTVSSNSQQTDFYVQDQTGKIQIVAEGANWDPEVTCSEVRQSIPSQSYHNTRYVSTRYTESAVPVDKLVYILGQARDAGGLSVRKPEAGKRFIISLKSEEELAEKAKGSLGTYQLGAMICAGIGAVLVVYGLVA
jgi:hypothetical protein